MIIILTKRDGSDHLETFNQMFRGRAAVFHQRLQWDVIVRDGMERDRYDEEDAVSYIVAAEEGQVVGSLRLLPMTGQTMLRNEFSGFFSEPVPDIAGGAWECTRFCVHPLKDQSSATVNRVSSELLIALCKHSISSGVEHIVGLYEAHMARVYHRIGWTPQPLARAEARNLVLGIWNASDAALDAMQQRLRLLRPSSESVALARRGRIDIEARP